MIKFISQRVKAKEAITTATAIVTGSEPELTNILLQQLAIALYCYQNKIIIDLYDQIEQVTLTTSHLHTANKSDATTNESTFHSNNITATSSLSHNTNTTTTAMMKPTNAVTAVQPLHDTMVQSIRVEYSMDGVLWKHLNDYNTDLSVPSQVVSIPFTINDNNSSNGSKDGKGKTVISGSLNNNKKSVLLRTNYIKITPLKWINISSNSGYGAAMRVQLQRQIPLSDDEGDNTSVGINSGGSSSIVIVPSSLLSTTITVLVDALNVMIDVMEYLQRSDDYQHEIKQLELKKVNE